MSWVKGLEFGILQLPTNLTKLKTSQKNPAISKCTLYLHLYLPADTLGSIDPDRPRFLLADGVLKDEPPLVGNLDFLADA